MQVSAIQPHVNAADLPLEQLAGNSQLSEQEKVGEASRQFEALLVRQMLTEARKTVIHSDNEGDATTRGIYDDMVNQQLADSISRSGKFGFAHTLNQQLTKQLHVASPAASPAGTAPPAAPAVAAAAPAPWCNFTHRNPSHE